MNLVFVLTIYRMPNIQLQFRRDTAANWTAQNPLLASGEMAIQTDSSPYLFKIGDGVRRWIALPYGGLIGATGTTGDTGTSGYTGDTGASGTGGATGATGAIGDTGPPGQATETGATGSTGYTGAIGDTGSAGDTGDTGDLGATGDTGATGRTGYTGDTGDLGATGDTGFTGATGAPGGSTETGATGATGDTGDAGATGATGDTGDAGDTGDLGATGYTGDTGDAGATGDTGAQGDTGDLGTTGSTGATGASGGSLIGLLKVPAAATNFDFSAAVSSLPASFGTYVTGGSDASTFSITLNASYTATNLPLYIMSGYVYSATAGYINVQRQFGVQAGVAAAQMTVNSLITTLTFTNMTKTNFPYTTNDSQGYAMYIVFQILN